MIGIVPSQVRTFEVIGDFNEPAPNLEGSLYVDPTDGRLYLFSTKLTRSSPESGYFPIWDGSQRIISKFSNEKYLTTDVIRTDLTSMSSAITTDVAAQVKYQQLRSANDNVLQPTISHGDNMFTQIIKSIISQKQLTMVDLIYLSGLSEKIIRNFYSALTKIAFMRLDRWKIWLSQIFHLSYVVTVYRDTTAMASYRYPEETFETTLKDSKAIVEGPGDPFKKLVKLVMSIDNLTKANLRADDIDDYTINNMLTTINTEKQLSAQLFSRFIRMAGLNFRLVVSEIDPVTEKQTVIFEYTE